MLPDYISIKSKLRNVLLKIMKKVEYDSSVMMSQVNAVKIHEGNKCKIIREDGTSEDIEMKKISVELKYNIKDIENKLPNVDMIKNVAQEMSIKKEKMFIEELDKIVTSTGNIVDSGGSKFSNDHLFKLLEKISIDFDENGNPYLPTIYTNSDTFKAIESELKKYEDDPENKKRYDDLISKKREEWNERESNRKLVG